MMGTLSKLNTFWSLLESKNLLLYIENPKDPTQKLLNLINEFSEVTGYTINIQKSLHSFTLTMKYQKRNVKKKKKPFKTTPKSRSKKTYNPAACGTKTTFTER